MCNSTIGFSSIKLQKNVCAYWYFHLKNTNDKAKEKITSNNNFLFKASFPCIKSLLLNSFYMYKLLITNYNINRFLVTLLFAFQKCKLCRRKADEKNLLVCCSNSDCAFAYHPFCLRLSLDEMPKHSWLCPVCQVIETLLL